MIDMGVMWIIVLLVIGGVMALLIVLLARRKSMSYQLIIASDSRRGIPNTSGKYVYNLRLGAKGGLKAVKIYSRLISFFPVRVLTEIADPRPFIWYGRTLIGIMGPSGDSEDDTLILIRPPRISGLDIKREAQTKSAAIWTAMQTFIQDPQNSKKLTAEGISDYIKKTFNSDWIVKQEGADSNHIDKDEVLTRSTKVAYVSEVEHAADLEAKHKDTWSKIAQFAPVIAVVILMIGVGIAWSQIAKGQAEWTSAQAAAYSQLYTYEGAQSLAIGRALAAAGIYGYNFTPQQPPSTQISSSNVGSLVPTVPKT